MKPTHTIILDTRRKKKSGLYPIKLRVTFRKEQRYYSVGKDLSKDDYTSMLNLRTIKVEVNLKRRLQEVNYECNAISVKASEALSKIQQFSFSLFEKKFLTGNHASDSVYLYYEIRIKELRKEGRVGTASCYSTSGNSLQKFSPKLLLRDITVDFLLKYEQWLLSQNKSISTVGIYLRPLRAIINLAIEEGSFDRDEYPFNRRRYQIPASKNKKKALTLEEIGKIINYEAPTGSWYEKARDFFAFSYLGNGINMKDILLLKQKDIDGEYIRYIRAKTQRANRTASTLITIWINEEVKAIIKRWGNKIVNPNEYIFPVLEKGESPERQLVVTQQFIKMVNTYLKLIVAEVGIDKPVTTYYARHSFATILKRSGASPLFISESLGHASLKTTESYLDSFEDEQRKGILENLRKYKRAS